MKSPRSWLVKPREPFNSRIWGDIAANSATEALITGTSWLRFERTHEGVRVTAESPAVHSGVE